MDVLGSKGCINYNPTLAMRQRGYPLAYKPEDKSLEAFVLYDITVEDPKLARVIHTWEMINQSTISLNRPRNEVVIPYAQWIK